MLWPLTVDWLCAVQAGQVHAAPTGDVLAAQRRRRRTVDTVCGRQRAHLYTATALDPTGKDLGPIALTWPPPHTHNDYLRCALCWHQTGRRRPSQAFRELRQVDPVTTDPESTRRELHQKAVTS